MRRHLILLTIFGLQASIAVSQVNMNVFAGYGPAKTYNLSEIPVEHPALGNEYAFGATRQKPSLTGGIGMEYFLDEHFFLYSEVRYTRSETDYRLAEIESYSGELPGPMEFNLVSHRISVPIAVGFQYDAFHIRSGIDGNLSLNRTGTLTNLEGFTDTGDNAFLGWHAAIGADIGPVGLEVRYAQDFQNVGSGINIAGKDMSQYGATYSWQFMIKYHFLRK